MFLFIVGWCEIVNLRRGGYHKGYTQETSLNKKDCYDSVWVPTQVTENWRKPRHIITFSHIL